MREREPHRVDRPQLVREWVTQKVLRDMGNPQQFGGQRVPIAAEEDALTTVELAFLAMKHAAALMTRVKGSALELLPFCRFDDLVVAHPRLTAMAEPTGIVLNSLLVPVSTPPGAASRVGFSHRLFQEFFLGVAISEGVFNATGLVMSESVAEWFR